MAITHPVFTADIRGEPGIIFDLVADMPNYGQWLPGSIAFGATADVTPYPVQLGTTYLDHGPMGHRPGKVTEFDRPKAIGFHHVMIARWGLLKGDVDVAIRYTLEPRGDITHVERALDLTIAIRGLMRLAEPLVARAFRKENERIMAALKRHVEALPPRR